ncbi:response regulator transcription factor [Sinomonas sp. ASV486]|uniref:Response regulator transcription factor n=1 Tax=Sinomonas puerhi TaxID=3238584 RepID=A0AB39L7G8_9MICC|nr:response regulator transcription factor [Sinomonas sp. ASV486]MDQ4492289.1 response regulator transcription factor [Sinomonas sp. ASV486]
MRVALVNDYEVVVRGVASMLRTYRAEVEVVELDLREDVGLPVDITLYDTFASPQGDRPNVHRLSLNPRAGKVVVYSWNMNPGLVAAALANGASAYLSKALSARQLVDALKAVYSGEHAQLIKPKKAVTVVGGDWPGREEGLTQREAEVLALITQGLSNAEIVEQTLLSINSVKTYIRSCYRRIGVTNRANAILWGIEHGFRPDRGQIRHPRA